MVRITFERAPDNRRQGLRRRRRDAQRLVDELGARRQLLFDLAEVVLAEGEDHLDWQRTVQYRHEQFGETLLRQVRAGLFEQGHELLELVEDQ